MKNIFCLFERSFKIQKNGVFRFEKSFSLLEILVFFYYANKINDDVILQQLKSGKNWIPISLEKLKQCSWKNQTKQTAHGIFNFTFRMQQHTSLEVTFTKYQTRYKKTKTKARYWQLPARQQWTKETISRANFK